eukprot:UN16382
MRNLKGKEIKKRRNLKKKNKSKVKESSNAEPKEESDPIIERHKTLDWLQIQCDTHELKHADLREVILTHKLRTVMKNGANILKYGHMGLKIYV